MLELLSENPIVHRAISLEKRKHRPGLGTFLKKRYVGMLVWFLPLTILLFDQADPSKWSNSGFSLACRTTLETAGAFSILCFAIRAVQATASSITQEREQRTFESMTSTLMGPSEVVVGKLWVATAPLIRESLEWLPLALFLAFFAGNPLAAVQLQLLSFSTIVCSALLGMLFSYWAKSSQDAGRLGGVSVLSWLLVLPTLGALGLSCTGATVPGGCIEPDLIDPVALLSPLSCWTRGVSVPNTSVALSVFVTVGLAVFAHLVAQQRRSMTERTR